MKKIVSITIVRFFSFFLVSVLLLTCNKDEVDGPQERQVVMTKSISSAGGRLALSNYSGDSVIITIPAGALVDDVNITMRILDEPPVSSVSKIVFPGLVLEPSGLIFKKPAKLEIKFSNSLVDELLIFTLNQRDQIRIIETNKISYSLVRGEILHFSPYFVGIPTLDELITLLFEIVVYGGDMNALGILETLGDVYSLVGYGNILNALDQSDKSNEAVDAAKSMLTEKAFEILGSIPSNPCGDYQTSLGYFTQVMAKILPGSDALKMINLQAINIEKECESEGPFDICKYVSEISVSKDALQLDKNGTHQLSILSYNSDGELLDGYDIEEVWSSDDPSLVSIEDGLITAGDQSGCTEVTATVCGISASAEILIGGGLDISSNVSQIECEWAEVESEVLNFCEVEVTEQGVFWGTDPNPEVTGRKVIAEGGLKTFYVQFNDLIAEETYYAKGYVITEHGTFYGNEVSFNTPICCSADPFQPGCNGFFSGAGPLEFEYTDSKGDVLSYYIYIIARINIYDGTFSGSPYLNIKATQFLNGENTFNYFQENRCDIYGSCTDRLDCFNFSYGNHVFDFCISGACFPPDCEGSVTITGKWSIDEQVIESSAVFPISYTNSGW